MCWITFTIIRGQVKCDGTRTETRFRLSAKQTSPIKSAVASVQSTVGSRGVRTSCSNAGYTMFRGSVKGTGYPLHSPVSPSLPLPCVTLCHHVSTGVYQPLDVLSVVSCVEILCCEYYGCKYWPDNDLLRPKLVANNRIIIKKHIFV